MQFYFTADAYYSNIGLDNYPEDITIDQPDPFS